MRRLLIIIDISFFAFFSSCKTEDYYISSTLCRNKTIGKDVYYCFPKEYLYSSAYENFKTDTLLYQNNYGIYTFDILSRHGIRKGLFSIEKDNVIYLLKPNFSYKDKYVLLFYKDFTKRNNLTISKTLEEKFLAIAKQNYIVQHAK